MGESGDEFESFEITDYDLQSELNPGGRRKQTKEQAMLGVWAEDDDEKVQERKRRKKQQNYAEPMGFVAGGTFHEEKDKEKADAEKAERDDIEILDSDDEDHDEVMRKAGFLPDKREKKEEPAKKGRFDSVDALKKNTKKNSKEFAKWEKYSKGFGSKMLEKMGYKGGGLGKKGEGIIEPIIAFKRKGKAAVGAYGSESAQPKVQDQEPFDSEEEEEQKMEEIKKEIEVLHQWKKTGEKKGKPNYVYKTADEVKQSGKSKKSLAPLVAYSNMKVVDMTGPQTRVLQGYGSLGKQHAKPGEAEQKGISAEEDTQKTAGFALPELEYNLELLVDTAESEIVQIDRELRHERDNVVNLTHELERLDTVCAEEEREVDHLKHVLNIINRCKSGLMWNSDKPLTLEGLVECFHELQENYMEEYKLYCLDKLVIPLGFPLLQSHFSQWQPFQNATYGIEIIKMWKQVLVEKEQEQRDHQGVDFSQQPGGPGKTMSSFERLIWDVWLPILRKPLSAWSPRQPDPLIQVIEAWYTLLPEWILSNILDQLVMPKLSTSVEIWNPLTDPVPIHSWVHPWLSFMGDRLEPLYSPIRQKLSKCLVNWEPADPSAKIILEPWKKVWSKGSMEAFLLRSIYPKLEECMKGFKINPHQQLLEPFHHVMAWCDLLSQHHITSILEKYLFPKWLQVLRQWLTSDPNFDEVTKWYLGWKSLFPENYLVNNSVKEHFNRGLVLMNQVVNGTLAPGQRIQSGAKENIAYLTNTERRKEAEKAAKNNEMAQSAGLGSGTAIPTRFKELLEQKAESEGILFIPIPNRRHVGKTVYSFGKCTVHIDRDVVFYSTEGTWKPVSLDELIGMSR